VRQLFSRVFDLALAAAIVLLVIGSATGSDPVAAKAPDAVSVDDAYRAEVVEPPVQLPAEVDPRAVWLADLARRGHHWRLDTANGPVHVWTPQGYDPATAQTVVYVHGYWQDADTVWFEHRLPEQFALSGANALFVVPEAPRGKWDRVMWPSTQALLAEVARTIDVALPKGRLAVMGHSGAYRTVIQWLADPRIDTVVLLDAAYVDVLPYRQWVRESKNHRFLNVSIDTIRWSNWLHHWLPSTVTVEPFPRELTEQMRKARILYVKSDIGHWPLVTDGVAIPQMLRALDTPRVIAGDDPPLGLPSLEPQTEIGNRAVESVGGG
jgi:hypothetical protein